MELHTPEGIPDGLLELPAAELHRLLPGPTLLHLRGRRRQPLFTAVLQHGNETVGWDAVRELLSGQRAELPRDWLVFIGNVAAARQGYRRLDDQPDYNRSWPGHAGAGSPLHDMLGSLTDRVRAMRPLASVDVHANTGRNPHYAVINALRPATLNLAALFGRTALYFTIPNGVQSAAFEQFCPAVTVECGPVGHSAGVDHAARFLDACLRLDRVPEHSPAPGDLNVYETTARLTLPHGIDFGFDDPTATLSLEPDLDALNFHELPAGTRLGKVSGTSESPVRAHDLSGTDVTSNYLTVHDGSLFTNCTLTPAMLTRDTRVIRQDCLGYVMTGVSVSSDARRS